MKRTRILAVVLTVVMLLAVVPFSAVSAASNVWDGSIATKFPSGDGSLSDPYLITNGAELVYLSQCNTQNLYFELANDIILNDTSAANWYENANEWMYIEFYGHFDGNGYSIIGLCTNPDDVAISGYEDVGLFGYAYEATISNVNVKDAYFVGTYNIGGIVGYADNCYINDCTFDGIIKAFSYEYVDESDETQTAGGAYAGGISGYINGKEDSTCSIIGCINYGDIYTESYNAAGIVGGADSFCYVGYCENHGSISGESYSGGIAGEVWGSYNVDNENETTDYFISKVFNCDNYGSVIGNTEESYYIGGIAGYGTVSYIEQCRNFGDVSSDSSVGGIAGRLSGRNEISYCANYGEVSGEYTLGGIIGCQYGDFNEYDNGTPNVMFTEGYGLVNHGNIMGYDEVNEIYSSKIGGIAGTIEYGMYGDCYNYGDLIGISSIGGIIGEIDEESYIDSCYNNAQISAMDEYAGGIVGNLEGIYTSYIYGCTNKGYIFSPYDAGGIVGYGDLTSINECQNLGTIEGCYCAGGIAGYVTIGDVSDCLNTGLIIVNDEFSDTAPGIYGGGIMGETTNVTIADCVNAGSVEIKGTGYFGGIVGDIYEEITIVNCYYLKDVAEYGVALSYFDSEPIPYNSEYNGTNSISASKMKTQSTFVDFDFEDTWFMGNEHPELMYAEKSILGDANLDGNVDKKDYATVKRACLGTTSLDYIQMFAADANGDGAVDKKDYALVKRACLGIGTIK